MPALLLTLLAVGPVAVAPTSPHAEAVLHLRLERSWPAAGDTLAQAPPEIALRFSLAVSAATSEVRLLRTDGAAEPLPVASDSADRRVLRATVPPLASGAYRVEWRVVSPDGHPVTGDFVFFVRSDPTVVDPLPETPPPSSTAASDGVSAWRLAPVLRGAASGATMGLAGLLFFLIWLGPDARLERTARVFAIAAPVLVVVHVAAWLQSLGTPETSGWVRTALGQPGRFELVRFGAATLAVVALVLGRLPRTAFALASVAVLAGAAIGHAWSYDPLWNVPAKGVHLAASALWFGGLLVLVFSDRAATAYPARARRVSEAALVAVIAVTITGIAQVLAIVPDLSRLVASRYGLVLFAKIAGLVALIGFGAYHRLRVLPGLDQAGEKLRRSVRRELLVMVVVILLAGVLSYVSPPDSVAEQTAFSKDLLTNHWARH